MRAWLSPVTIAALLVACGTDLTWVTPRGQVFHHSTCDQHSPTPGGGPDTCLWRKIRATPAEEAKCEADGGYARGSILVPIKLFGINYETCFFPEADIGKACQKSTDCQSTCDADTHTCQSINFSGRFLDENGHVGEVLVE